MIDVKNLSKRYGEVVALDQISFTVARGEIVAFLGPNGAGKTTTMRILAGLIPATDGNVSVAGFNVFDQPLEVKRRIGYLPDTPPLYTEMTVNEYLTFFGRIRGLRSAALTSARFAILEKCGLTAVATCLIAHLSRGYRQRVGLAQAMIHTPEILILDEPTVGLDPNQIIEIRKLIQTFGGEHTVILSTHILPEATATCEKAVIINRGRIVAIDTIERLTAQMRKSEKTLLRVRHGDSTPTDAFLNLPGVTHVSLQHSETSPAIAGESVWVVESAMGTDVREALARRVIEQGFGLLQMQPVAESLEDVFLQLTTQEETDGRAGSERAEIV